MAVNVVHDFTVASDLLIISLQTPLFYPIFFQCPTSTLTYLPSLIAVHQWPTPNLVEVSGQAITDVSDAGEIPDLQFLAYPNQSDHHL